jgi:DNA polymerase-3 subunit delta'
MKGQVGEALVNQFSIERSDSDSDNLNAFINLSHLPELQDKALNETYNNFSSSFVEYLMSTKESESNSQSFLKLMCEQTHSLRWLEKITVNLLREQFMHNTSVQTVNDGEQASSYNKLSPKVINELYKAIIEASKVLKLLPQANTNFVLEKLNLSLYEIARGQ